MRSPFASTVTAFDGSDVPNVVTSLKLSSVAVAVTPSNIFSSSAVEVTSVPPMSSVVTDTSPSTVAKPFDKVTRSVSSICPMYGPSIFT